MTVEQQDAVERINANVWGVGGYIGAHGRLSDICNQKGIDRILNDARIVAALVATRC